MGYWDTVVTNAYLASRQANQNYGAIADAGTVLTAGGALTQAIGVFASVLNEKNQLKAGALTAQFQSSVAAISARRAEKDAQALMEAGQTEIGLLGMRYAQEKAAQRTSTAAGGVVVGTGSSAEALASTELAKKLDARAINLNSLGQVSAARARSVNASNESLLARASARNLSRSASTINPGLGALTSLIGSSGAVATQWVAGKRAELYARRF